MSLNNLNNHHLSDEQKEAINEALAKLEQALESLNINLTPEDRNRYGRVNEQNKLFIHKTRDYALSQPNLKSPDVDWAEFEKDFQSRNFLETVISRLNNLSHRCNNSKIFHDFDNYQDSLADYAFTQFRASSKMVGFEEKYKEQKQFFRRPRKGNTPSEAKQDENNDLRDEK
ncbi:hypothetical protein [Bergeyella zoohelcum]|uniref:Uncharacterized protein n=1 Tax=Bergeyella zoohelcum ATCC 43767 TaxID=883096 RepID=K1MUD8_9FLAO|nr:hypothetical protein [Bergeyella zoohelcum]EKB59704.1 hypothetical protein HMPREF9699_00069 [Bergeyella zoohelcum ATCC 43767]SUV49753.1 Uncharacterised protein [Bergeyella zoohelcum]